MKHRIIIGIFDSFSELDDEKPSSSPPLVNLHLISGFSQCVEELNLFGGWDIMLKAILR